MAIRTVCMNCRGNKLSKVLDLGLQPNGNNFPTEAEKNDEPTFPMMMQVCETCWQVQIAEFPSQEFLFSNHPYVTGVNVPVVQHFEKLAARVVADLKLKPQSLVIDIGCNDGTLLEAFRRQGMRVMGVDPGQRTGDLARQAGKTVCQTFWNEQTGQAIKTLNLKPDVITATAVFYHVPDLHSFVEGLRECMGDESVFVVQCVNLKDLIEKNQFDHFYHEHSCIHAIAPMQRLFEAHSMRLLDVQFSEIHGGSFVCYVGKKNHPTATSPRVAAAIQAEKQAGLQKLETYKAFSERVHENTKALRSLLVQLKRDGKRVVALGAPVKGNTLLNFCQIGPDLVECATEVNQFKIGRLTPGTHIPIIDEKLMTHPPDYYLILSWNFLDFLVGKYKSYLLAGGKFIVPVPSVRILGFDSVQVSA